AIEVGGLGVEPDERRLLARGGFVYDALYGTPWPCRCPWPTRRSGSTAGCPTSNSSPSFFPRRGRSLWGSRARGAGTVPATLSSPAAPSNGQAEAATNDDSEQEKDPHPWGSLRAGPGTDPGRMQQVEDNHRGSAGKRAGLSDG